MKAAMGGSVVGITNRGSQQNENAQHLCSHLLCACVPVDLRVHAGLSNLRYGLMCCCASLPDGVESSLVRACSCEIVGIIRLQV